jgi:lipase maturation factor 1
MAAVTAGARAGSGPAVARLFDGLLAGVFLIAWLSLGAQIDVLAGARGLLPAAPWAAALRAQGVSFGEAPTIFAWVGASDGALHAGVAAGVALSVLAFAGVAPRLCFGLGTLLYLSYAVVCRTFLGFQWDNLLLECGFLAVFLPRDRRAPAAHFALRVLLFKLYFESGIAKWQSPLGDWKDGSAMTFYYETAPLPARLGWYAHALPEAWHHFESWFTLFFELAVPLLVFGPRRGRLVAFAVFALFQGVNLATANYGFFSYLALALQVFLLDDGDVVRVRAALERRAPVVRRLRAWQRWVSLRVAAPPWLRGASPPWLRRWGAMGGVGAYLLASVVDATAHFSGSGEAVAPLRRVFAPLRLVSTYHLFGAITRERIEPELQTFDGTLWTAHDLRHKPGDVARAPDLVAPHQPRVDFQLWFHGLSYRRGAPPYVTTLIDRACHDPAAIDGIFAERLPEHPVAVRMAFFRYHFTTAEERRATGAWWKREWVEATRPVACGER